MSLQKIRTYFTHQAWPTLFMSVLYFLFSLLLIFVLPKSVGAGAVQYVTQVYSKNPKATTKKLSIALRRDRVASSTRKQLVIKADFVCLIAVWLFTSLQLPANAIANFANLTLKPQWHARYNYLLHCCWRI